MAASSSSSQSAISISEFKWFRAFHRLSEIFQARGFEVRLVGGAVRDLLLDLAPRDLDVCTDALPEEMMELLNEQNVRHLNTGAKHGTFTVFLMRTCFEVTSLRCDTLQNGTRIIQFGKSFEEDARVRDLTVNSMSVDVEGRVYDYYGGRNDLATRTLRFVENAEDRIAEDPLRILRFFRLSCCSDYGSLAGAEQLGYLELFEERCVALITQVSPERVWKELMKILASNQRVAALDLMGRCGILTILGFPQRTGSYAEVLEEGLLHSDRETRAGMVLGVIFHNLPTQLEDMCDRLRVSNRIRYVSHRAVSLTLAPTLDHIKRQLYSALPAKYHDERLIASDTLTLHKQGTLAGAGEDLATFQRPIFPLTKDHFAAVADEFKGKYREVSEQIREEWIAAGFTMTIDQMMERILQK